jgi:TRAP-type C4-dicarboxylate transport system permease small subunit
MEAMRKRVDRVLEWALIVLMAANVLNVLWQVFTRFVLKDPSSWTEELARFLLIWVALLGASYAAGRKMHLAIDVVLEKLEGRTRVVADLGIHALILVFGLLVMVVGGVRLVYVTLFLDQTSAALQIKLGYVYLVLPLSGTLIVFYSILFIAERARALAGAGKEELS